MLLERAVNVLLLKPGELAPDGTAHLAGRRLVHAREVLRVCVGDRLRCGLLGGALGDAEVLSLSDQALVLRPALTQLPPPRPRVDMLLALPRPKALKRLLPQFAQLGVDRLVLLNAARVEKSYFSSPALQPALQRELMLLGLEQACDTVLPEVLVRERFRPFVEDELDGLFGFSRRLLAHPAAGGRLPQEEGRGRTGRTLLAIGPEGGWVPFELDLLQSHGFQAFSAGPRILRTETAVPYLMGLLADR